AESRQLKVWSEHFFHAVLERPGRNIWTMKSCSEKIRHVVQQRLVFVQTQEWFSSPMAPAL
ncbi:MAG: hypothetical protein EBT21_05845, partial [Actinobacteria bacterium]|nr:hypothetical protein [Actinomycetota bacterium]